MRRERYTGLRRAGRRRSRVQESRNNAKGGHFPHGTVPAMDASGLHAFKVAIEKLERDGIEIFLTAVQPQPMKVMFESGLAEHIGLDRFCADIDQALTAVRKTEQS